MEVEVDEKLKKEETIYMCLILCNELISLLGPPSSASIDYSIYCFWSPSSIHIYLFSRFRNLRGLLEETLVRIGPLRGYQLITHFNHVTDRLQNDYHYLCFCYLLITWFAWDVASDNPRVRRSETDGGWNDLLSKFLLLMESAAEPRRSSMIVNGFYW